jgi:PHP family Zn ribbon phosphoesterase
MTMSDAMKCPECGTEIVEGMFIRVRADCTVRHRECDPPETRDAAMQRLDAEVIRLFAVETQEAEAG